MESESPIYTIYDLKQLILQIHGYEISQQMICLDKILFADQILLSDLKANTQNLTTINRKEGDAPGR